jgi:hypothetical protein
MKPTKGEVIAAWAEILAINYWHVRRRRGDFYHDFCKLPGDTQDSVVCFASK